MVKMQKCENGKNADMLKRSKRKNVKLSKRKIAKKGQHAKVSKQSKHKNVRTVKNATM